MDLTAHAELSKVKQAQISVKALKRAQKIVGKSQKFTHPSTAKPSRLYWLMRRIETVIAAPLSPIKMYKVMFENMDKAAEHNAR